MQPTLHTTCMHRDCDITGEMTSTVSPLLNKFLTLVACVCDTSCPLVGRLNMEENVPASAKLESPVASDVFVSFSLGFDVALVTSSLKNPDLVHLHLF